ncbi:MAG: ion channel [Pyrinomonadaceae bacterium]
MTQISPESDNKKLFFFIVASASFSFLSLIFFGIGCWGYTRGNFIEHDLSLLRSGEQVWLALLLFLPLGALIIGMPILIRKAHRDDDTALFYSFCLFLMSLTPLSYCVLWAIYVYRIWNTQEELRVLSWIALVVIGLLVSSVIYMTFLIMWTPAAPSPFLKLSDIKDWKGFCDRLVKHRDALASQHNYPSLIERLDDENKQLILQAPNTLRTRKFHKETMLPVVLALNDLMTRDDFLETKEFDGLGVDGDDARQTMSALNSNDLNSSFNEVQILHRNFLDTAYAGIIKPLNKTGSLSTTVRSGKQRFKGFQIRLKEGMIKSPFWATVFFFTIFLGITYLFCFAFAFHDRSNLMAEKKPALFSPRSPIYNVGDYTIAASATSEDGQEEQGRVPSGETSEQPHRPGAPSWPEYVFYFDTPFAEFKHREQFGQENFNKEFAMKTGHERSMKGNKNESNLDESEESPGKRLTPKEFKEVNEKLSSMHDEWKLWKNYVSLTRLVNAIALEDDATHGQGLQILLRGAADEKRLDAKERPGVSYPSNYTLSEARAQAVKYVLLERLANSGKLQSNFQWVLLPMSNEDTSIPKSPEESQTYQQRGNPNVDEELDKERERLNKIKTRHRDALLTQFNRISKLKSKGKLYGKKKTELLSKLKLVIDLNLETEKSIREEWLAQDASRQQATEALNDAVEAIQYEHVDEDAGKRVVVVSIKPAQQSPGHLFAPLSLMDYMYFTIYTITTTGYGDIMPMTPYAKFLCSSANILEVFFFVVFFNGLLSMKRSKERSPVEYVGREGGERPNANSRGDRHTGGAVSSGNANSPDVSNLETTLTDVRKLLTDIQNSKSGKWRWPFGGRG